jgi:ribosomal protein S18 acetylase RimI-like enzyme
MNINMGGYQKVSFASDLSIHEMQAGDYDEIYELWRTTPGIGLSDADKKGNIQKFLVKNKGLCYVCRHENKIIGTILCGHDGRRGYIYHVTVADEYRRKGIGKTLVEKSLSGLKEAGIDKCHLFVIADNAAGNDFWASIGWVRREDILVYSKLT